MKEEKEEFLINIEESFGLGNVDSSVFCGEVKNMTDEELIYQIRKMTEILNLEFIINSEFAETQYSFPKYYTHDSGDFQFRYHSNNLRLFYMYVSTYFDGVMCMRDRMLRMLNK